MQKISPSQVSITCSECHRAHILNFTIAQEQANRTVVIQKVAPDLTADQAELIMSGVCGKGFDKMFEPRGDFTLEDVMASREPE